jgi:hypothetical protein
MGTFFAFVFSGCSPAWICLVWFSLICPKLTWELYPSFYCPKLTWEPYPSFDWIFQSLKDPILRLVTSQKKTRKKKNRYLTQGKVPYEIFGVFNLLTTLGISKLKGPHSRTFSYRFVILFLLYPVDTCQLSKGKVFVNSSAAGALCQVTPSKPGNITEPGVTHNMVEPPVLPTT